MVFKMVFLPTYLILKLQLLMFFWQRWIIVIKRFYIFIFSQIDKENRVNYNAISLNAAKEGINNGLYNY